MKRVHLEVEGIVLRRQPPIVGDYCKVPHSGLVDADCGYEAATCEGVSQACPRCEFTYCAFHYTGHVKEFVVPPDTWKGFLQRLRLGIEGALQKRNSPILAGPVDVGGD